MNSWVPKKKIVRITVAILSISIIIYCISLFLISKKISGIENEYYDNESEASKEERIRIIKTSIEKNKEDIQELRGFLVPKDNEVGPIEQIEAVAKNASLKFQIESINLKKDEENQYKENLEVKISTEGTWENIFGFLNSLEKMPFGVMVERLVWESNAPLVWAGFIEIIIYKEK